MTVERFDIDEGLTTNGIQVRAKVATRLSFFAAGFGVSCWAPMMPYVKATCRLDDGMMGLVLLLVGVGSILTMPVAANVCGRMGYRSVAAYGITGLALALLLLSTVRSPISLAATLFFFGSSIGAIDVSMNLHGSEVEQCSGRPMMSGFHALYSFGSVFGVGLMTILLSKQISLMAAAIFSFFILLALLLGCSPRMLLIRDINPQPWFAAPRGAIPVIAVCAALLFLFEGALLDWSALLLERDGHLAPAYAGLGFMFFSVAMMLGRLTGDYMIAQFGNSPILVYSGFIAFSGLSTVLLSSKISIVLGGFVLIGLGTANIAPIIFRCTTRQDAMPKNLAVGVVTTAGYGGMLIGPGLMGALSEQVGLHEAFWTLAMMLLLVPLLSQWMMPKRRSQIMG